MADGNVTLKSPAAAVEQQPVEELEQELTTLAAHLNAGNYRFLRLLAEFDRRGGHVGWGIVSCAHWLQWKCGIGLVAARDKVRVARALEGLPKISDGMRRGVLSYCKVRALTRIATPENEDFLVQLAESGTVSHVEKTVRLFRKSGCGEELAEANKQHAERYLRCYFDDNGELVLEGRIGPEQGALIMKALQAAGDALREAARDSRESCEAPDAPAEPYPARQADALALVCETFLARGAAPLSAGDRHLVTVHIDERDLRSDAGGGGHLDDGPAVPATTVRRLCCDASLVAVIEREDGSALDVGRKTRAIPPALRRALEVRDRGCRFPGCTNGRFVDAHHIHHWADGGETKLDNLVLLCRRHHRFVHEYGFHIKGVGREVKFFRPDGREVAEVPPSRAVDADDGTQALIETNSRMDIRVDARTSVPKWMGERMDYGEAVGALQARTR